MKEAKSIRKSKPGPLQERRSSRFRTIFTGKIRQDGKTKECVILDLSATGAKLKDIKSLTDTPEIDLIIDRLGPYHALKGKIMWRRENQVGIVFEADPEDMREVMSKLMPSRWSLSKDSRN